MQKFWRRQHLSWRWLIRAFISFVLVISIFSNFSNAAGDFDVKPGEIKRLQPQSQRASAISCMKNKSQMVEAQIKAMSSGLRKKVENLTV